MKTKNLLPILFLILFATQALGATQVINPPPINNDPIQGLKEYIATENVKTRTEFIKYTDQKINDLEQKVETDVAQYIDDNFKVLDDRMHSLAIKVEIQFCIAIACTIIFSSLFVFFIITLIKKIGRKPDQTLKRDKHTHKTYGVITPEFKQKIEAEDQTIITPPIHPDTNENITYPPSMTEIEQILHKKHLEDQQQYELEQQKEEQKQQQLQQIQQEKQRKQQEKEQKRQAKKEQRIQKLREKLQAKELKIQQKLDKLRGQNPQ